MTIRERLRQPFVSTPAAEPVDLRGKHIIVTGCAAGSLGYATALQLAEWGATVIVSTRHATGDIISAIRSELAQKRRGGTVDGHELDLAVASSVIEFTHWYNSNYGERLDVLVNNAGIHLDLLSEWKQPQLADDGCEIMWRTNYLGTVHLTHNLLPLLLATGREHGDARVVNVVSQLHNRGSNALLFDADRSYESWQAYGLSKLALMHYTTELHKRYRQSDNLQTYSVHPGGRSGTYTNVADKGLEGHALIGLLRRVAAPLERVMMASPAEGAQTQIYCATSASAQSSYYHVNCQVARSTPDSLDESAAARLWSQTQEWLADLEEGNTARARYK
jgi:retinol dehydrogenase-12